MKVNILKFNTIFLKILGTIGILILALAIYYKYNEKAVDITSYNITNKKIPSEFDGFKIVELADFHSSGYKQTTDVIIEKVKKINPDIIVMAGDMVSWQVENIDELYKVVKELSKEFTIYYINGNHEQLAEILSKKKYDEFISNIKKLGVTYLKDEYIKITKGNEFINLYELDIPLDDATGMYIKSDELDSNYINETIQEADDSKFNILLAHTPLFIDQYSSWGADLVLSGHMHGGIVRIPFINKGIVSPEKVFFPKYDAGKFEVLDTTMIVNRGIGASSFELRVFNNPEISVITLKSNS